MPSSALNPAPTLADLQRGGATAPTSTTQHPAFGDSVLRRRRSSHSSHDSHGSHSSHSSHSSYAARHPDRVPQKAASPNGAFLSVLALLALVLVYTLVGLWLFVKGFLLTRHELTRINQCIKPFDKYWSLPEPPPSFDDAALLNWAETALDPSQGGRGECRLAPTHGKAVLLIIDALRYDFIAPPPPAEGEGGWSPNPYYHNILTRPSELTSAHGIPALATKPGPSSFVAHFAADPPTTTLQRLKGLTTGTLPTFVEAGANFGSAGTGVGQVNEDNWIAQFKRSILESKPDRRAGLVFAGDDTWSTVFSGLFDTDTMWTYDSFNVEDLDTVDRGVEDKLLPFLQKNHPHRKAGVHDDWRLLVGHTLGVDHVGHRFGASHPKMKTKLEEMQILLQNITDSVDDETVVIVMGDHGMDERGDHGGDAELEIGAGIWFYSRSGFGYTGRNANLRIDPAEYISSPEVEALLPSRIPFSPLPSPPYPAAGHRSIPQIDLVPTLSVLLGLPIPYNNLGSIIPELFPHPNTLLRALRITATQMRTYLNAYSAHSPDLASFASEFDKLWLEAVRADAELAAALQKSPSGRAQKQVQEEWRRAAQAYHRFNRASLVRAREVWAQFDMARIGLGLLVLSLGMMVALVVRKGAQSGLQGRLPSIAEDSQDNAQTSQVRVSRHTEELYAVVYDAIAWPGLIGAAAGTIVHFAVPALPFVSSSASSLTLLDCILAGAALVSQVALLSSSSGANLKRALPVARREGDGGDNHMPATTRLLDSAGWVVALVHAASFASNSFLVFEDRFVVLALATLLLIRGLLLLGAAPTTRLKIRAAVLTAVALVLVRVGSIAKVCREEQAPHCTSTFFASSSTAGGENGAALNSPYTMAAAYVLAYTLPSVLARFLAQSKSYVGIAPVFFTWVLRPSLMLGAGYWILDYVAPLESVAEAGWGDTLVWVKGWVAKLDLILLVVLAMAFWVFAPLCLEIRQETSEGGGEEKTKVSILGYANSLGSSYLLLVGIVVAVLWIVTQPAGQLALGCIVVAAIASVELGDAERDVLILHRQRASLHSPSDQVDPEADEPSRAVHLSSTEVGVLALLGYLCFFSSGHQATLSSIQWRVAFLTSRTLTYPLSPALVVLNSFGHVTLLPPLLVGLAVMWNTAPLPRGSQRKMALPAQLLSALLTLALYNTLLLVSTAGLGALVFNRHLMLFKVWVPRFMLSATVCVLAQLAALATVLAAWQTANKVNTIFGSEFA